MGIFGKDAPSTPPGTGGIAGGMGGTSGLTGGLGGSAGEPGVLERERPDPFESLLKLPVAPSPANTVIAPGMTVTGSLEGDGTIHIEGRVVGEIKSKGTVVVAKTGEIRGPVATDTIQVAGRVAGNVTARRQLHLEAAGSIDGDISCASLMIENGGSFNGKSTMLRPTVTDAPGSSGAGGARLAEDLLPRRNELQRERPRQEAAPAPRQDRSPRPYQSLLDDDDDDDFPSMKR